MKTILVLVGIAILVYIVLKYRNKKKVDTNHYTPATPAEEESHETDEEKDAQHEH